LPPTFEDFVAERLGPLLRYATTLACDPVLAQDIVQEVLLRAQQRWPRIRDTRQPAAYLRRMVTNEYLSLRRRRATRDVAMAHADLDRIGPPTADPAAVVDERATMLARIARLPRRQRAVVVLRYYENLPDEEIAAVLGCSAGTVRSHVSRALVALRAQDTETRASSRKGLNHAY
jgi:RNA polymerase sigma-70 factor (sigma-E family)